MSTFLRLTLPSFSSDYQEVVREFERAVSRKNTTEVALGLRYVQGTGREQSFGGNFSFAKRVSFFDRGEDDLIVPCGFLTDLPISELDRAAMDKCRGVVVVSAVFNDHDKIRQPRGLGSETLASGCFFMFVDDVTLTSLAYHKVVDRKTQQLTRIGVWRLVRVPTENLYENPAMNGVIFKYLAHRLFVNARFSVWVDAKMQLVVDPLLLVHALVVEKGVDLAVSKHPFFVNAMEEAVATAAWKKWRDVEGLRRQIENYCAHGLRPWSPEKLPYTSDVPDTAIILRRHGGASDLFSCLMFNELDAFNPRDQLAFAYVRDQMRPKIKMNMFEVEVFERIAVEYRHNLKRDGGGPGPVARTNTVRAKFDSLNGSCREYLSEMWGEGGEPRDHLA
uniref:TOD1/MUCI70 glycosyltransferase-like domain-containing protein n=1 Tax=Kalanchoe fedtschenkoi TaxID=63787 RepID=A0A7N0RDU9_KALFE